MNVLPRLLYLFQALPVEIPTKQFNEWRRMILGFVWKGKQPRVPLSTLQLPKNQGGRGLPSLEDYYKAAQLRHLVCWCNKEYDAKWKDLEQSQLEIPLQSILGDRILKQTHLSNLNYWTTVPLEIWFKECRNPELERKGKI